MTLILLIEYLRLMHETSFHLSKWYSACAISSFPWMTTWLTTKILYYAPTLLITVNHCDAVGAISSLLLWECLLSLIQKQAHAAHHPLHRNSQKYFRDEMEVVYSISNLVLNHVLNTLLWNHYFLVIICDFLTPTALRLSFGYTKEFLLLSEGSGEAGILIRLGF